MHVRNFYFYLQINYFRNLLYICKQYFYFITHEKLLFSVHLPVNIKILFIYHLRVMYNKNGYIFLNHNYFHISQHDCDKHAFKINLTLK